jgi:hypothetical protein
MSLMKSLIYVLVSFFIFTSCEQLNKSGTTGVDPNIAQNSDPLYVGHWLSECNSSDRRIYTEISSDLKVKVAYLDYSAANCTGTYELTDGTNTITEPVHVQNITEEFVESIPDNFFVLKYTNIGDMSSQYVVMYANDAEHYDLIGFTNPHQTWTQWQGEGDVFAFSQNPTTYEPTSHEKIHFSRSELP